MRSFVIVLWFCTCFLGMVQEVYADTTIGSTFEQENDPDNLNAPEATITASATSVTSATAVKFTASATDADGDTLSYAWYAGNGAFTTATTSFKTVYWQAPTVNTTTEVQVTLTVGDGHGKTTEATMTITVTPVVQQQAASPDYVLQECAIDDKTTGITLYQGQGNVPTGCFVVNQGAGAGTSSSYTYFHAYRTGETPSASNRYGNHYVIALDPGESSYEGPNLDTDTLTAGSYTLYVQTDATSKVSESSEGNNTATLTFTVMDPANLPNGTLVMGVDNTVYLLDDGFKRPIGVMNSSIFEACGFTEEEVVVINNSRLEEWDEGDAYPQLYDQVLITGPGPGAVYILQGETKRGIVSAEVFNASQFDWGAIIYEPYQRIVDALPDGENYPQLYDKVLITGPSPGAVYVLEGNQRRGIVSAEVFNASQFDWNAIHYEDQSTVDAVPEGWTYPQLYDEVLITGSSPGAVYILQGETKRGIVSAEVFNEAGFDWNAILYEDQSIVDAVPTGRPFTGR